MVKDIEKPTTEPSGLLDFLNNWKIADSTTIVCIVVVNSSSFEIKTAKLSLSGFYDLGTIYVKIFEKLFLFLFLGCGHTN